MSAHSYLALLRNLSASAPTRLQLLKTVASFWRQNPQFHLIVLDKLLQYRLVDSVDVISWVFASADEHSAARTWSDIDTWSALDITIKSVQIRIASAKARLETLTREQEVKAAEAEHEIDLGMSAKPSPFNLLLQVGADFSSSISCPITHQRQSHGRS